MRRFSGVGGSLYALGERLNFQTSLYDCGDGWDWRAPDALSYWLDAPKIFAAGELITPVEVHLPTGRVGLPRNMKGYIVQAFGHCRPISWLADGDRWEVNIEAHVPQANSLGSDHIITAVRIGQRSGVLRGAEIPIGEVLARFPLGGAVFTGIGESSQVGPDVHIQFKEGVQYVPR